MSADQDALIDRARELLDENGQRWNTLSGRLWSYEDYGLWEVARQYFDGKPQVTTSVEDVTTESEFWVWCVHDPWRLRLDYLRGRELPDAGKWPETTVVDGQEWRTRREGVVERGMMAPNKVYIWPDGRRTASYRGEVYHDHTGPRANYSTPGLENLDSLVEPAEVASGFTLHGAEMTTVAARHVIRLHAQPVPGDDFHFRAAGLVLLGVDDYRLSVDVDTGIIVEWEALVDGRAARRQVLAIDAADDAIDGDLFVAPVG